MKTLTAGIISVVAFLGAMVGSYWIFRRPDQRTTDKTLISRWYKVVKGNTKHYAKELFRTNKSETLTAEEYVQ